MQFALHYSALEFIETGLLVSWGISTLVIFIGDRPLVYLSASFTLTLDVSSWSRSDHKPTIVAQEEAKLNSFVLLPPTSSYGIHTAMDQAAYTGVLNSSCVVICGNNWPTLTVRNVIGCYSILYCHYYLNNDDYCVSLLSLIFHW